VSVNGKLGTGAWEVGGGPVPLKAGRQAGNHGNL